MLQVLIVSDGIARLRAGVNTIEELGLLVKVVAETLEVLIPVGKFNNDFDLGIHLPGWADN